MSSHLRTLLVGDEEHRKQSQRQGPELGHVWLCRCSCGRMEMAAGGASAVARVWQQHVEDVAMEAGTTPRRPEQGPRNARERRQRWWAEQQKARGRT